MKTEKTALRWIVPALDPHSAPVVLQGPGGQAYGAAALRADHSRDIAGLIGSGPIDHLAEIIVDGQKIWPDNGPGLYRTGQPNPVRLTIKHYYTAWLYWGTAVKIEEDFCDALLAAGGHLPYGNQAVLCFPPFFFGRGNGSIPLVECKVASMQGLENARGSADEVWAAAEAEDESQVVLV